MIKGMASIRKTLRPLTAPGVFVTHTPIFCQSLQAIRKLKMINSRDQHHWRNSMENPPPTLVFNLFPAQFAFRLYYFFSFFCGTSSPSLETICSLSIRFISTWLEGSEIWLGAVCIFKSCQNPHKTLNSLSLHF